MATVSVVKPNTKTPLGNIKIGQLFLGLADRTHLRTYAGSVRLDDGYTFPSSELGTYGGFEVLPSGTTVTLTS